jgi:hypothetical protein
MKIPCPRCHAENDTELAEAGRIKCECGQWFNEQPTSPWIKGAAPVKKSEPPLGIIIWPVIMGLLLLLAWVGWLPWLLSAFFILLTILGAVVMQFSHGKK